MRNRLRKENDKNEEEWGKSDREALKRAVGKGDKGGNLFTYFNKLILLECICFIML